MRKDYLLLKDISLTDERFRISHFFSLDKLLLSIKKVGLINPPMVVFRDSQYIIASGWKRVFACMKLKWKRIPVYILDEQDDKEIFIKILYENLALREYTLLEKAEILLKLKKFRVEERELIQTYLPLLDVPPTARFLEKYLTISKVKKEIKKIIHERNMSFAAVCLLLRFEPTERRFLIPLLKPLGQNKQKEFLEDLYELCQRNRISAKDILQFKDIQRIQKDEKLSHIQKAERIRLMIKRKRYPTVFQWTDTFKETLKKISWPDEITIKPAPFFETEQLFLSFSFKTRDEFLDKLQKLKATAQKKEFSEILTHFNG